MVDLIRNYLKFHYIGDHSYCGKHYEEQDCRMKSVPSVVSTGTCLMIRRLELSFLHKNKSHVAVDRMRELDSSFH